MKLATYYCPFSTFVFPTREFKKWGKTSGTPPRATVEASGVIREGDICLYKFEKGLYVFNLTKLTSGYVLQKQHAIQFLHNLKDARRDYEDSTKL